MRNPAVVRGSVLVLALSALAGCNVPLDGLGQGGGGGGDDVDSISVVVSVGVGSFPDAGDSGSGGSDASSGTGDTSGSGGPTSSGSGTGGAPPSACPGEPHALATSTPVTIFGSTQDAPDLLDTCWTREDGGERVYDFTTSEPGVVLLEVTESAGSGFDAALVILDSCGDLAGQTCWDVASSGERTAFYAEAGSFTVVVDSMGGTQGGYSLVASLSPSVCGDGVLGPGEICDVGPGLPDDGCGDPGTPGACQLEQTTSDADVCPGEPVVVGAGTTLLAMADSYTTLGFTDDYKGSCMPEVGGPDRVFAVTSTVDGVLTARVGFDVDGVTSWCGLDASNPACFDIEMYARSTCESSDVAAELACASTCCDGETITFPVTAGATNYVFVDGYDGESYSQGPFNLQLTVD